jgi:hypothetical protein
VSCFKPVTDAPNRYNYLRPRGVCFNLFSKTSDMDSDGARARIKGCFVAPYLGKELFTREHGV